MRTLLTIAALLVCQATWALIPASDFAKHPSYRDAIVSPTGEYLAISMVTEKGDSAIAVLRLKDLSWTANVKLRGSSIPHAIHWVNDERILVRRAKSYFGLKRPIPNGELFAMNFDGSRQKHLIEIPYAVTAGYEYANHLIGFATPVNMLPDDPSNIMIHFRWYTRKESNQKRELYKLNVYTGAVRRLAESPTDYAWFLTDAQGEPTYSYGALDYHNWAFHKYVDGQWQLLAHSRKGKSDTMETDNSAHAWKPIINIYGSNEIIAEVEKPGATNAYYRINAETGTRTLLYQHERVDPTDLEIDPHTNTPFAVRFDHHYPKVHVLDAAHAVGKWYQALNDAFPGEAVAITGFTKDHALLSLYVNSDKNPGTFYLFDTKTKQLKKIFDTAPWINPAQMHATLPFDFKNRDGVILTGYYTAPSATPQGKAPLVVMPHGGPHARDYWGYDSDVQFLASRGYGVLQVNFRGSSGFGVDFLESGKRHWGDRIQHDIIDATQWIIKEGIVDKDKICIYGASFGGYSALMAPTLAPGLYKCAIGYVGVYDLSLMREKGDIQEARWGEDMLDDVIGNDQRQLATFSPINHLDKLSIPVLLAHGAKDERAHVAHYHAMKKALDKKKHSAEYFLAKGEGHGFYDEKNREKLYKMMEKFLARHIGK